MRGTWPPEFGKNGNGGLFVPLDSRDSCTKPRLESVMTNDIAPEYGNPGSPGDVEISYLRGLTRNTRFTIEVGVPGPGERRHRSFGWKAKGTSKSPTGEGQAGA